MTVEDQSTDEATAPNVPVGPVSSDDVPPGTPVGTAAQSAGAQLKATREAAGLSLDQVAQQLKLAPRQVKALEDENFDQLPGRTFTRGFVRNYARLLALDASALIALLPDSAHAPSLEAPLLHSTRARMGELPSSQPRTSNAGRWLIPLILIACVGAAAAYEWYRTAPGRAAEPTTGEAATSPAVATTQNPASGETGNGTSSAPALTSSVQLPNPLINQDAGPAKAATEGIPAGAAPATGNAIEQAPMNPAPTSAPIAPMNATPSAAQVAAPGSAGPAAMNAPTNAPSSAPTGGPASTQASTAAGTQASAPVNVATIDAAPAAVEAPLSIATTARSWVEVRDRRGRVLISQMIDANSERSIEGIAPFSVVVGRADASTVIYRGAPVDLAPYTRANVARLVLR